MADFVPYPPTVSEARLLAARIKDGQPGGQNPGYTAWMIRWLCDRVESLEAELHRAQAQK